MPWIRIGAAALNLTPLAWESNRRHILAALEAARDEEVSILCLPELCISGYGCEDMFLSGGVRHTALELLSELVARTVGLFTGFGLPLAHDGSIYNAVAVACNGVLVGFACKQYLAGDGIHYEPRWFSPWPAGKTGTVEIMGKPLPIGDLLFYCGGICIGFEICRDAWMPNRPGAMLGRRGASVILNPSASHFAFGKQAIREGLVTQGSRDFEVCYAYANLLGNESGRSIYEGGSLIANEGQIVARGPRFSFADVVLTHVCVNVPAKETASSIPADAGGEAECAGSVSMAEPFSDGTATSVSFVVNRCGTKVTVEMDKAATRPPLTAAAGAALKEEEFSRAVPLGLFDYLRKSGARGFVISLSGGADSSATAVLVYLAVELATREIGWELLREKLRFIDGIPGETRSWVRPLLACVYQSTRNSSPTTRDAARTVSAAIGAHFFEWDIDRFVEDYVRTISSAAGRQLTWDQDDVALQNIQARVRGPGAWMLANLRKALLLTTSNRSEAAVGYATMDGDTCGGLAPIAGIDKAFLRDWLCWMEHHGLAGIGPFPFLSVVNEQQPTAELRPPSFQQTDEHDLMPYNVLDAIEKAAIRDKKLPVDVWQIACRQFTQYDRLQLGKWVERFFQLWCQNQWKRERYAPSFHLDDENLDPKTWCRFPILSGGFQRELEQLRERVEGASDR